MKLSELDPHFLSRKDDKNFQQVDLIEHADGIRFLCPKCFKKNGGPNGTHSVICWEPHVPQTTSPSPGRWTMNGKGYDDLTLTAPSSSIRLMGGCEWHGFIKNGEVTDA